MKVFNYRFESLQDFVSKVTSMDCANNVREHECVSQTKHDFGTYHDAIQLVQTGWPEGIKKVFEIQSKYAEDWADKHPLQGTNIEKKLDFTGDFLDIDSYIKKEPEFMGTFAPNDERIIATSNQTFLISISFSWNISSESIMNRGAYLTAMINALEERGTRCNIYIVAVATIADAKLILSFPIKKFTENLDLDSVNYCLSHPSLLRCFMFRHVECFDEEYSKKFLNNGYGMATDLDLTNPKELDMVFSEGEILANTIYYSAFIGNNHEQTTNTMRNSLNALYKKKDETEGDTN